MPEGPEVRRCAEQLERHILDRQVLEIRSVAGKLFREHGRWLFNYHRDESFDGIPNPPRVKWVDTKGKAIFITLSNGHTLVSTLGMSGWWYPERAEAHEVAYVDGRLVPVSEFLEQMKKHTRLELVLNNAPSAVFIDPRNFGNVRYLTHAEADKYRGTIGLDLLREVRDDDGLLAAVNCLMTKPNKRIGELLLDQSVLSGLGNIYRAETLYIAGINPYKQVKDLTTDQLEKLVWVAVNVLNIAYHGRGTMRYPAEFLADNMPRWCSPVDGNYVASEIRNHLVYGRKQDQFGHHVVADKSAGRTMWWVPQVQL